MTKEERYEYLIDAYASDDFFLEKEDVEFLLNYIFDLIKKGKPLSALEQAILMDQQDPYDSEIYEIGSRGYISFEFIWENEGRFWMSKGYWHNYNGYEFEDDMLFTEVYPKKIEVTKWFRKENN